MDALFNFEDQPSEEQKPISDNPCVRLYGPGPEDKLCKDCKHLIRDRYHDYTYPKCDLRKLTRGPATDHRVRWQACKKFEQSEG